ncbi:TRAF3-interacting protein 1-like [Sorghum bicolor]|uniref:TRAF3-interacting protein 1-like n=1 Tax=Sorghum bicolor TaxID=4558 RepID=UPI000B4238D1|nr:TRAF3-interacting protein 1-like [Sorghum bicolor]|eukprot:XP_021321279.1 TRAF3-interacting protein 1-like [Sorghum bicolor]
MSNKAPTDDEVAARVRAAVAGDFQPECVNGLPMRPDEGSIDLGSFDDRSSRPPVKEDDIDRDRRRESAEKQKSAKDLEKKKEKKKNLERQVLETRRAKSRQRVEPEEDSPDEGDDNEGDDGSDDSEGMVARLDKILEDPPQADVDIPWMGAPKRAPDGHQREPSPSRSRADTPPLPAPGRAISRPQPPPAPGAGHRVKTMATGPLTRGRTAASSQGDVGHGGSGPNARRSGDVEPKPAPAHKRPGVSTRGGSRLKRLLEQAQPLMAKKLKVGAAPKGSGGPASISTEPGREDGVVAITCAMRTPVDPQSEIKGSLYGMDGLALGFLRDWRPWEEPITEEGGKASTSGGGDANEIGTLGRSMTTGGSLLSSTFFCATEARLRPFKS